jgi:hypothetical protein
MSYKDAELATDKRKNPVPQYYNPIANQYEVIQGRDGANSFIEKGQVVVDSWNGTTSTTRSLSTTCYGFALVNDGTGDLTITIGGLSFLIKPGETYNGLFKGFTSVQINGNSAYRAEVRE